MNIFKKLFSKNKNIESNNVVQNDFTDYVFSKYDETVKLSDSKTCDEVTQPLYPLSKVNNDTVPLKDFESNDFSATVLLSGNHFDISDETVLFNSIIEEKSVDLQKFSIESIINKIYLINPLSGEKININKLIFTIGSGNEVDCTVNAPSVSGNHASVFLKAANEFYIVDNGSTNGTQVEGVSIEPMKMVSIENGDLITFGEELYQFYIEG